MKLASFGAALLVIALLAVAGELTEAGPAPKPRLNIVVIQTDDQTPDSVRFMTNVRGQLARAGTTFANAFAATPLATPSRATLLTGMYAHNDGVRTESDGADGAAALDARSTLPVWLRRAGYTTAMVGRYLAGYGEGNGSVPSGWNEWDATVDPWSDRYYDYVLNENGRLVSYGNAPSDYETDVANAKALSIVDRLSHAGGPFFLWLSFLAPRAEETGAGAGAPVPYPEPAPRHVGRFASEQLPMSPSFNEADVRDKPGRVRARPLLTDAAVAAIRQRYQRRLESLLAVDDAVGAVVARLRDLGKLDDTLIVFTSATGFLEGQHRIPGGAGAPYEPSIRIPLIVRGPGIPHDRVIADPVATVDLAPTVLEAAGAKADHPVDGSSLLPLARDPLTELGRDILLEARTYSGLRTPRYKYVEYAGGARELYDLAVDPYELSNRARSSAYAGVRAELARRLAALRDCSGGTCRRGPRLTLKLAPARGRGRAQACAGVTVSVGGADLPLVGRVDVYVDSTRIARDSKPPFRITLPRVEVGVPRLRVHIELSDSRRLTVSRAVPPC